MQHLAINRQGEYGYRNGEEGEVAELKVYYDKGGTNMFSGNGEARGIRALIQFVTVAEGSVSFVIGDSRGGRVLLLRLARKNDAALIAAANKVDTIVSEVIALFLNEATRAQAFERLKQLFAS